MGPFAPPGGAEANDLGTDVPEGAASRNEGRGYRGKPTGQFDDSIVLLNFLHTDIAL